MKPVIKYISLLLFGGLILPFYNSHTVQKKPVSDVKPAAAVTKATGTDTPPTQYFIYRDIAEMIFPNR